MHCEVEYVECVMCAWDAAMHTGLVLQHWLDHWSLLLSYSALVSNPGDGTQAVALYKPNTKHQQVARTSAACTTTLLCCDSTHIMAC